MASKPLAVSTPEASKPSAVSGPETAMPVEEPAPEPLVEASPVKAVAGPPAFADWLQKLPLDTLQDVAKNVDKFVAAERLWREEHLVDKQVAAKPATARRQNVATRVDYRLCVGLAYGAWRRGPGHGSRATHKDARLTGKTLQEHGPHEARAL